MSTTLPDTVEAASCEVWRGGVCVRIEVRLPKRLVPKNQDYIKYKLNAVLREPAERLLGAVFDRVWSDP